MSTSRTTRHRPRRVIGMLTTLLLTTTGLVAIGLGEAATAAGVTSSTITSPADGTHYLVDGVTPSTVTVTGTANGTPGVDTLDVRCYYASDDAGSVQSNVAIAAGNTFTATMHLDQIYGTCVLRAVPHGSATASDTSSFTGPTVTSEWNRSSKITSGINAGKIYNYSVLVQSAKAMNQYTSATFSALNMARLQYSPGNASNNFWYGNASFTENQGGDRPYLKVDGHDAYGPWTAANARGQDAPGLPSLTYSTSRNATTGTTTIHEVEPLVRCADDTYPPTSGTCPTFLGTGIRLERTIVTDDGGRQVHFTDTWRSTDGHPHTVAAHYDNWVYGYDQGDYVTDTAFKLPWLGGSYRTFTAPTTYLGTSSVPATIFVHDSSAAPDGDTSAPRGAITFDTPLSSVYRSDIAGVTLREDGIAVPAGGGHVVRHDYVMGTTEAEIVAKAAASRERLDPFRPDGLIKKRSSTYVGNGVYNTSGAGQMVMARKKRTKRATFYVDVQNDSVLTDTLKLLGTGNRKGFSVAYFAGTKDITSQVEHGTYTLKNLAPGQQRVIKLVITLKATAKKGALRSWLVTSTSTHATMRQDTVRASVRVKK